MVRIYLGFNAAIYALFAFASMINPERTQRAIGFFTVDNSGSSEFLTIYAGLEAGFAAFYLAAARSPDLARPGLMFSVCLYAGIAAFRLPSLLIYHPVRPITLVLAAGEVTLLLVGALLLARNGRSGANDVEAA